MKFELLPVENIDLVDYKHDMQEAFQLGAAVWEENLDEEILSESHIDKSLNANGSIAYKPIIQASSGKMTLPWMKRASSRRN